MKKLALILAVVLLVGVLCTVLASCQHGDTNTTPTDSNPPTTSGDGDVTTPTPTTHPDTTAGDPSVDVVTGKGDGEWTDPVK